jgi:hypothetical protein
VDKSILMIEMPELNDKAIGEIHSFLKELVDAFESHYYCQLQRFYQQLFSSDTTEN